jgi:drug/metabolite transporter (DMT)-like permease
MRERENTLVVVLHFQLVGVAAGLIFSIFNWRTPAGIEWLYLLAIGITAQLGQVHLTKALQSEKAANVSLVSYSGIIYALFFGWAVFAESYSPQMIFGILMVIGGVLLGIIYSSRKREMVVEETIG